MKIILAIVTILILSTPMKLLASDKTLAKETFVNAYVQGCISGSTGMFTYVTRKQFPKNYLSNMQKACFIKAVDTLNQLEKAIEAQEQKELRKRLGEQDSPDLAIGNQSII